MANYPPPHYLEHDRETLLTLMRTQPLATFIVADGGFPYATPVPMVLRESAQIPGSPAHDSTVSDSAAIRQRSGPQSDSAAVLLAHLDANNPCAPRLQTGVPALAIFHGPSSYITPTDYTTRQLPTYNYAQVHVRGTLERLEDLTQVKADLHALVEQMEANGHWVLAPDDARVPPLLCQIVGFRLHVSEITGRYKLSQDKRAADRDAAHAKLERTMGCPVVRPPSTLKVGE